MFVSGFGQPALNKHPFISLIVRSGTCSPQVLSLPGDILREANKSSAEVFGDIKTFLLLLGDERCKSMKAVGPGKIEIIVMVETVVLHILIQVWDGDDEYGATSWVSFRDLFRHDSVRLHRFARFLEGRHLGMGLKAQYRCKPHG